MRRSIRKRLLFTTSLMAGLSLLFSGVMVYFLMHQELLDQAIEGNRDRQALVVQQLDGKLRGVTDLAQHIIIDQDVQRFLKASEPRSIRSIHEIANRLTEYSVLEDQVLGAMLITREGRAYCTQFPFDSYATDSLQETWYQDFLANRSSPYFSGLHDVNTYGGPLYTQPAISYIMDLRDVNSPLTVIGTLVIHLNQGYFSQVLDAAANTIDNLLITDAAHRGLIQAGSATLQPGEPLTGKALQPTASGYYLSAPLSNGWYLVSHEASRSYLPRQRVLLTYFFMFASLSLVLILATTLPLQSSIIKPLRQLSRAMRSVSEGNLDTLSQVHTGDEIELLSDGFNTMLAEIRSYIDATLEQESEKKRLEFELMLSQINPHFIYNTLNTVIYLARQHRDQDIEHMTRNFIQILRDSVRLSEQGMWNTAEREVQAARHYLEIMRYRFSFPIEDHWTLSEEARQALMPRALIQPIVENALYHGLLPKRAPGTLRVAVQVEAGALMLTVEDDGVGMDAATVDQVLHPSPNQSGLHHIGAYNIKSRLDLLYGSGYQMTVDSAQPGGTRVTLTLQIATSP